MISCDQACDWMHDRFDGVLSHCDAVRLEEHLSDCDCCSVHFDELSQLHRGLNDLRSLSDSPVTEIASERVSKVLTVVRVAAVLALVVTLAIVASTLLDHRVATTEPPAVVEATSPPPYRPTIRLNGASAERFLIVQTETDQPNVHFVWLHNALPTKRKEETGPQSNGALPTTTASHERRVS